MKLRNKKMLSFLFAAALTVTSVLGGNVQKAGAEETEEKEKVTVYLGVQGKDAKGTEVNVDKTVLQVEEGVTADVVVKTVLDATEYKDNYEILDTGWGPYLESIHGLGTVQEGDNWYYWSFCVNGTLASLGLGSYQVQDNDKISLIYSYENLNTEADCFADDVTKNPSADAAKESVQKAKVQQQVLADAIYQSQFGDGTIPGIENTNGLYSAFSLLRAGYEKPEFYQAVYHKLENQLSAIREKGSVTEVVNGVETVFSEKSILESTYAENTYAKIVLFVSAFGKDATDIGGFNLIEKMASKEVFNASETPYITGRESIMLLALDSKKYVIPTGENYITRTQLVNTLAASMDEQIATGIAWGMDTPAMILQPLAPYLTEDNLAVSEQTGTFDASVVKKACEKGIHFMESMQAGNGFYGDSYSPNNAWSLAQVMVMMGQFGISGLTEDGTDFIKNGATVYDAANEFIDADNKTVADSLMSYQPEQLLRGLNAITRVYEGKSGLFDLTKSSEEAEQPIVDEPTKEDPTPETPASENKVKKITVSKAKVTVAKKKSAKVMFKVIGVDKNKKVTTKKVNTKVTGKGIKVTKSVCDGKKVIVIVKATKKTGKNILKVTINGVSAKTTIVVK